MTTLTRRTFMAAVAASALPAAAADWPRFRGPDLTGLSPEKGLNLDWPDAGPPRLWQADIGLGFSSVAVVGQRLYTMGNVDNNDIVRCLDAATGKPLWQHQYASDKWAKYYDGGTNSTPTVDGDSVYTFGRHGDVFCLDAANGAVRWSTQLVKDHGYHKPEWGFTSSPLVYGDWIILNAGTRGLALDRKTGKIAWSTGKNASAYATPIPCEIAGKKAFLIFGPVNLSAISAADGTSIWDYPWKTLFQVNAADPVVSGDRVFVSSAYGFGCAVLKMKADGAEIVWKHKDLNNHFGASLLIDGCLYGIDGTEERISLLKCVEFDTGKILWEWKGLGHGGLLAVDGRFIALTDQGELMTAPISKTEFAPKGRFLAQKGKYWTPPVIANGRLYIRAAKGELTCFDLTKK